MCNKNNLEMLAKSFAVIHKACFGNTSTKFSSSFILSLIQNPNVKFIKPCNLCPHMKRITLPKILDCLKNETNEILMSKETIEKARKSVERMTEIGR